MPDASFVEAPLAADSLDADAQSARKHLQAVLDELNPASGKTDSAEGAKVKPKKRNKKQAAAGSKT